jgi:hypothetical protein
MKFFVALGVSGCELHHFLSAFIKENTPVIIQVI